MEKFVLHQKAYDFTLWLYPIINRLPKNHRFVLGQKLEDLSISLLLSVAQANKLRGAERKNRQMEASDLLDYLRIMLRLAKDTRGISIKQYTLGAGKLNEIGVMLSSWMRSDGGL